MLGWQCNPSEFQAQVKVGHLQMCGLGLDRQLTDVFSWHIDLQAPKMNQLFLSDGPITTQFL